MASRRAIRELALQMLYLIDARDGDSGEVVDEAADQSPWGDEELAGGEQLLSPGEKAEAAALARQAYAGREPADVLASELAPAWPTNRQPAIDRAILRLAWCEMVTERSPARVAVNEAVELAKHYSTERSPAFINGLLDKMMRRLPSATPTEPTPSTGDAWLDDAMKNDES